MKHKSKDYKISTVEYYLVKDKLQEVCKILKCFSKILMRLIEKDNNITLKITRIRHEPNKCFGKDININKKIREFYDEVKKYKIEYIKK